MQEPRSQESSGRQPAAAGAVQCAPFGPLLARFTGRRAAYRPAQARADGAALCSPATAGARFPDAAPATAPSGWSS
jgi:hypothetical protein